MPLTETLTVDLSRVSLSASQLDALASEFYGVLCSGASVGSDAGHDHLVEVSFTSRRHSVLKTSINALKCLRDMKGALDSFLLPPEAEDPPLGPPPMGESPPPADDSLL